MKIGLASRLRKILRSHYLYFALAALWVFWAWLDFFVLKLGLTMMVVDLCAAIVTFAYGCSRLGANHSYIIRKQMEESLAFHRKEYERMAGKVLEFKRSQNKN